MKIVIDTETTGITRLSFANKLNYHKWPRIVQVAWALVKDGAIQSRAAYIIRPDGYKIPASASQIHGIAQQRAEKEGIPIRDALQELKEAFAQCDSVIAHNLQFDLGIIESEAIRQKQQIEIPPNRICTVYLGQKYLVRTKGCKRGGYPKLSQLYETLFGFSCARQHEAASDVTACFQVYKKLQQLGFE